MPNEWFYTVKIALIWGNALLSDSPPGSAEPGGADMRDGPGDEKSSAGG